MRERENWGPEERRVADELREAFRDALDRFDIGCDRNGSVRTYVGLLQYDHARGIFLLEGVNLISGSSIEALCYAVAHLPTLYDRCRKLDQVEIDDMRGAVAAAQQFLNSFPKKTP